MFKILEHLLYYIYLESLSKQYKSRSDCFFQEQSDQGFHYLPLLYTLLVFTLETGCVSIAESCSFHQNLTCHNAADH